MAHVTLGGCQCGAIRYALSGALPPAYACHCSACKKQSASAFSMSIVVGLEGLAILGTPASFGSMAFSGARKTCYFCPKCGTRLWHASSASAGVVTLKVGSLDDSVDISPSAHLWVSKKQAGINLDPNIPAFDSQPENLADWREGLRWPR
ncbi:MAG: GFA family protein [Pseudomonadota bacterium]